jgi:hypothetical protein
VLLDRERGILSPRQQGDTVKDERDRLPARLEPLPGALAVAGRRELPDAEVWREAGGEPSEIIAVGKGGLKAACRRRSSSAGFGASHNVQRAEPCRKERNSARVMANGVREVQAVTRAGVIVGNSSRGLKG